MRLGCGDAGGSVVKQILKKIPSTEALHLLVVMLHWFTYVYKYILYVYTYIYMYLFTNMCLRN